MSWLNEIRWKWIIKTVVIIVISIAGFCSLWFIASYLASNNEDASTMFISFLSVFAISGSAYFAFRALQEAKEANRVSNNAIQKAQRKRPTIFPQRLIKLRY